ncbi:hypothetical protein SUGI_1203240 [Cryptomeria japonica]|nr:hypothetical protein SUGI_1203240 [Cryptomeria japonica]
MFKLFQKVEDTERETVIQVLVINFWGGGHVHDREVYKALFDPIIQILGNLVSSYGIAQRMVREEDEVNVKTAMNELCPLPLSRIMIRYFNLNVEGKKIKMAKAWKIYKERVGKEYCWKWRHSKRGG